MKSSNCCYDYTAIEVVVEDVENNQNQNEMENIGLKDLSWMEGTEWCLLRGACPLS